MIKQLLVAGSTCVIAIAYTYLLGCHTTKIKSIPSFYILNSIIFVIQFIASIPAILYQTEKFYDLVGGLTFVFSAVLAMNFQPQLNTKQLIGLFLLNVWALRLAGFLFYRIMKVGQDFRFRDIKINGYKFFNAWCGQALWIVLTASPIFLMILNKNKKHDLDFRQMLGLCLFAAGFLTELVADQQKLCHSLNPATKDKFINHGLWKYSRHPNFCGEILLWIGMGIFCFDSLNGAQKLACLISPLFTYITLTKITGIEMIEKEADVKWGGDPAYQEYKKKTPILFPGIAMDDLRSKKR